MQARSESEMPPGVPLRLYSTEKALSALVRADENVKLVPEIVCEGVGEVIDIDCAKIDSDTRTINRMCFISSPS